MLFRAQDAVISFMKYISFTPIKHIQKHPSGVAEQQLPAAAWFKDRHEAYNSLQWTA